MRDWIKYNPKMHGIHFSKEHQLLEVYTLPHKVVFEPYLKALQYKVLNNILFTNIKLYKTGLIDDDKCSFCKETVKLCCIFSIIVVIPNYSGGSLRLSFSDLQSKVCSYVWTTTSLVLSIHNAPFLIIY